MKISRREPPAGHRAAVAAPRGPRRAVGRRGVPKGSEHQSWTNTGHSSDPSDDYKPRAALEGTFFFFLGENWHPPKVDLFFGV